MVQRVICLLTMYLMVISCRTEIKDEFPDFEKQLTVNALFAVGEPLHVHVSHAAKLDTSRLGIVENAEVSLYVNHVFQEMLSYTDSGLYISTVVAEAYKDYTCKVYVPGFDELSCTQLVPEIPVMTGIEHINIAGKDEEGTTYPAVKVTFKNNPEVLTYYEMELRNILTFRGDTTILIADFINIVDPAILNEGLPIALFSNELINDSIYTLTLNYTTHGAQSSGGVYRTSLYPFVVELRSVSYDYYRFKKQLYLYQQGRTADGIITSMTNANLYSNIDNGYGIFAGYSSSVSDTITPNLDGYYD